MACGSNYLAGLKDSEFLSAIKHRSAIPGGTCEFDLPDFFFWLNQATDAARALVQRVVSHAAPAVRRHRRAAVDHAAARQAAPGDRARRRLPHHLRARHAHPAGAHRAAGGLGAVSGDQRVSLPLLGAAARLERAADQRPVANYRRRAVHAHLLYLNRGCRPHDGKRRPKRRRPSK